VPLAIRWLLARLPVDLAVELEQRDRRAKSFGRGNFFTRR